jgi:hypothetical protein
MINAKEAKKRTDANLERIAESELEAIEKRITKATAEGFSAIQLNEGATLNNATIKVLKDLGYSVKTDYDQRENESWTTISWA